MNSVVGHNCAMTNNLGICLTVYTHLRRCGKRWRGKNPVTKHYVLPGYGKERDNAGRMDVCLFVCMYIFMYVYTYVYLLS